jgi:hypothetical protein
VRKQLSIDSARDRARCPSRADSEAQ